MKPNIIKSSLMGLSIITALTLTMTTVTPAMAVKPKAHTKGQVVNVPFAIIDMNAINTKTLASISAGKSLKALEAKNKAKLKALQASSTKKAAALRAKASKASAKETASIRKQLQTLTTNFNKKLSLYKRQIAYSQSIYNQELFLALRKVSNALRQKYGLAGILSAGSMLSASANIDLTKEAISDMNKSVKRLKAPNLSKVK